MTSCDAKYCCAAALGRSSGMNSRSVVRPSLVVCCANLRLLVGVLQEHVVCHKEFQTSAGIRAGQQYRRLSHISKCPRQITREGATRAAQSRMQLYCLKEGNMDQFEEAVLKYLCGPPERFVSAQFNIPYDGFKGGSCPDFLVLDFGDATVYVVEITSAADTKNVQGRIAERKTRWLSPLREHFSKLSPIFSEWDYHVTVFVRDEELQNAQKRLSDQPDVSVISLDRVVFSWRWEWRGSRPSNPLREPDKAAKVHTQKLGS